MSAEIQIDPAEALRRIISKLANEHRPCRANGFRPLWVEIKELTGYGSTHSSHLATMHGFNADTGEAL